MMERERRPGMLLLNELYWASELSCYISLRGLRPCEGIRNECDQGYGTDANVRLVARKAILGSVCARRTNSSHVTLYCHQSI